MIIEIYNIHVDLSINLPSPVSM